MKENRFTRTPFSLAFVLILLPMMSLVFQSENASGTLIYKSSKKVFNVPVKFAHFMTGPDAFDPKKKIRRLVFTGKDLEAKIKSCDAMNCPDTSIEGIQIDLDAAPRLLYWVNLDNGLVQYSGTAANEILTLTTESTSRLAGTIKLDASAGGGPALVVKFDASLLKNFTKAH
jgi:hypothetical protein